MRLLIIFTCAIPIGALLLLVTPIYKTAPVDPAWEIKPDAAASGAVVHGTLSVRFTGTSTLLFDDGDTQWMLDGWFSRPSPLKMLTSKIAPDMQAITDGLAANGVTSLDAVIPAHSHYDHAMDSPEVAKRTGAILMGSASTANIGRGWGLPEAQIKTFTNNRPVSIGAFSITPIETNHFEFADPAMRERALTNPEITAPLKPPVSALDYRLGKAYAFHIDHPKGSFAIISSAGYRAGALAGLSAQTVFLGIGGLGSQTSEYREAYWQETIETLRPDRIIPIHYDSLTGPIEGPFRGPALVMSFLSSGTDKVLPFLKDKEAKHPEIRFQTLPRYSKVTLFE
ncbi:MAG: MBL fold metallo-hydrolase [Halioglobus sp.]